MTSWRQENRDVASVERVAVDELASRVDDQPETQILDVREEKEWDAGHIPGSAFTPWHDIDALPGGLDPGRPIAVICASGQRAAVAASLVQRYGGEDVIHVVDGGVAKWGRLGHPISPPMRRARPERVPDRETLRGELVRRLQALQALKAGALRMFDPINRNWANVLSLTLATAGLPLMRDA